MFCGYCGKEIKIENAKSCSHCGKPIFPFVEEKSKLPENTVDVVDVVKNPDISTDIVYYEGQSKQFPLFGNILFIDTKMDEFFSNFPKMFRHYRTPIIDSVIKLFIVKRRTERGVICG